MALTRNALALTVLLIGCTAVMADEKNDEKMKALALNSGCFICHHVESGAKGPNGMAPIGPNWEDVALRYKGQKNVADGLVRAVMQGSNPYGSHWKDKVSGLAMPPNAVAISESDARKLVNWKRREKQQEVRWHGEEAPQARREDARLMAELNCSAEPNG